MSDALEEHNIEVSVGGRTIANLRVVDDSDALVSTRPAQGINRDRC